MLYSDIHQMKGVTDVFASGLIPEPDGWRDADSGEEIIGEPVVSGCDTAKILEAAEHPLNGVAIR